MESGVDAKVASIKVVDHLEVGPQIIITMR